MGEQIRFVRNAPSRRTNFQLTTIIKSEGQTVTVHKLASHANANDHLASFQDKRNALVGAGIGCDVADIIKSSAGKVVFPFINGTSLESKLHEALLNNSSSVIDTIELAFKVVDSLPATTVNPVANKQYTRVFGDYYSTKTICIAPACIDFNLDNFIEKDNKLTLIDYEWVFDFPVPKDFIKLRLLHHAFLDARTLYLKSNPEEEIVAFNDSFFVPKYIYDYYGDLLDGVDKYMSTQLRFLHYALYTQNTAFDHYGPKLMPAKEYLGMVTPFSSDGPRYLKQLADKDAEIAEYKAIVADRDSMIGEMQKTLAYKYFQRPETVLRKYLRRQREQ